VNCHCERFSAFPSSFTQNFSTTFCCHSTSETVLSESLSFFKLSKHFILRLGYCDHIAITGASLKRGDTLVATGGIVNGNWGGFGGGGIYLKLLGSC